ncbi:MAG: zinc ABC transporter substrate-binding protein [Bdellovibrionaceae bacterium]|nr:zinc ABC transporter substrate-binding protein [Pseudobdellovibrionaceae bacterium]MBX3033930.1 zinc ABC transporter substrate-binding protein [Pseudobdellovibrionaceae bacterium]
MNSKILFFCICLFSPFATALTVVTTLPEFAEIAREIAPQARVESLLVGGEDPHFLDARPALILKTSKADVVISNGLDLEVGWLPKVLSKAGIADLQPGGRGFCEAGQGIEVLDKPSGPVDRSMGDVHPAGNPHYTLSPAHLVQAARFIKDCLVRVDPAQADAYEKGLASFTARMNALEKSLRETLKPVTGDEARNRLFEYHRELAYFAKSFDLHVLGSVEEKPGLPPSAARLSRVAEDLKSRKVRLVLASRLHPESQLKKIQDLSGVPFRQTDFMAGKSRSVEDTLRALTQAIVDGTAK